MAGVSEIRASFLDFFGKNGHEIVPSSPLVPRNDPTLMFTNAGMVQFKNVFTGQETRAIPRATTSQKCVRAGGKHNDLDNVGYTARHHTFFEMLGNFSFGDYFKERAIELAWNLLTKEFGLKKDKLLVTIYHTDDEAYGIWKKISGFPDSKIIRIATNDNFWQMGDTGPCGPCSEIFFDHGDKIPGGPPGSADADGDRFIEIWNLVFMQFEQIAPGNRVDLPRPSIDTGMGLERVAAVLQGKHDNYDIDLFQHLIQAIRQEAAKVGAKASKETEDFANVARRVIADHLRSSSFLIADGVLPSNEGRGYVLRRIMRRAMRYAAQIGCTDPLMYLLVPSLVREMGDAYPELVRAQPLITETLKLEETKFKRTLDNGLKLLGDEVAKLTISVPAGVKPTAGTAISSTTHSSSSTPTTYSSSSTPVFPGDVAFKLYDTYGFPLDLTEDALKPRGITVDTKGFDAAMKKQREKARASWSGSGDTKTADYWFPLREKYGATEFLGYETEKSEGVLLSIIRGGPEVDELRAGESGELIFNQTPFYAESGGQVSDTGWLVRGSEGQLIARVLAVHKEAGDLFVHNVKVENGAVRVGDSFRLEVDHERRAAIRRNHSATHLLHEALRQVLGDHIAQRGSLVAPDRLRFDFSHNSPIAPEQIRLIEDIANEVVLENSEVRTRLMAVDDAREAGARALFGEKYGDEVRVVSMGSAARDGAASNTLGWSVELCGGTHVSRTGDIGLIRVVAESGSSAGVRRLEALTGEGARAYLDEQDARVKEAAAILRTRPEELVDRLKKLVDERKQLERQLADAKKQIVIGATGHASGTSSAAGNGAAIINVGDVKFLARQVEGLNPKDLRGLIDDGKKQVGSGIVAVVGVTEDGKAGLAVGVTEDLVKTWSAVDLVKVGAEALGGKGGGGRPDMAQAGGPDGAKAGEALKAIEERLAS